MGNRIAEDRNIVYYSKPSEYDEVEGVAPMAAGQQWNAACKTSPACPNWTFASWNCTKAVR